MDSSPHQKNDDPMFGNERRDEWRDWWRFEELVEEFLKKLIKGTKYS